MCNIAHTVHIDPSQKRGSRPFEGSFNDWPGLHPLEEICVNLIYYHLEPGTWINSPKTLRLQSYKYLESVVNTSSE